MGRLLTCRDCGSSVSRKARACPACGRPIGRSLLGQLVAVLFKVTLIAIGLVIAFAVFGPKHGSQPDAVATDLQPPSTPSTIDVAEPVIVAASGDPSATVPASLPPGSTVEITGGMLYRDLDVLKTHKATGTIPNGGTAGRPVFGLMVGTHARVESTQGEAVKVQVLDGNWSGRSGWLPIDEVRLPATAEELAADVTDGLPQDRRREIYAALNQAGMAASREAERRYPHTDLPTDQAALKKTIAAHRRVYEARKKEGRIALVKRYKVDGATLDRIEAEGEVKHWPLGD